ncbi:hypothetical protein MKX01_033976 [Papaver californicum]|nr:hypothetical protein MKX01_033976 [Papaver californicum]
MAGRHDDEHPHNLHQSSFLHLNRSSRSPFYTFLLLALIILITQGNKILLAEGFGCNWGTRATHPLPADIVVKLLQDNGFDKVKLFEPDPQALTALGTSGIQVMLGIPNEFLASLASSVRVAEDWVQQNVSYYIRDGVDIRYVAVGNEPFLKTYGQAYLQTTFPALKNIQAALIKAGLGKQVQVTVPLNADVYQTDTDLPSGGDFRPDIHSLMISIVKFLSESSYPLTINIYPFLSLYADSHFPVDYAFFSGTATPVVDGPISYSNVFEANYDTLIWALEKNGFPSVPVIIGEVGWPTDGDPNANAEYARRFNQGLFNRIFQGQGTPKRKSAPQVYVFGLIDEDAKSIAPGSFERHWGMFNYDGTLKYSLQLGNGRKLVPAKGVKYLEKQWCVMSSQASTSDPMLTESVNYACTHADCTSLGYGSSCGGLDAASNASYAFNRFYQTAYQQKGSCNFNKLAVVTTQNPNSQDTKCKFDIMIDVGKQAKSSPPKSRSRSASSPGRQQNSLSLMISTVYVMLVLIVTGSSLI